MIETMGLFIIIRHLFKCNKKIIINKVKNKKDIKNKLILSTKTT